MLRLVCPLLLLLCVATSAQASGVARTPGFYQGTAEVDSRDRLEREAATRAALTEVLVRMTGDVSISMDDAAAGIVQGAPRFVRSYRYVERELDAPEASDVASTPASTSPRTQQYLLVDFDAAALARAVKEQGLPLWDDMRPVTVMWLLAPTEEGPRSIWGRVEIDERFPALRETANLRGVPIRLPEMDIEDRSAISTLDLVAEDATRLEAASARYNARHVLLVRLRQSTPNLFEAQWTMLGEDDDARRWASLGQSANQTLAEGMAQYANQLARDYALELAPGWVQSARVRVVEIDAIGGYARAMAYLQRLNLVESVQPTEVLGRDVVFLVEFEGSLGDLERSIEVGGLLIPAPEPPPATPAMPQSPTLPGTTSPQPAPTPPAAQPQVPQPQVSGLSFFAVSRRPELRYRLAPQ